jgi:transposase
LSVRSVERYNLFEEDRTVVSRRTLPVSGIVVGVDTHKDEHVAVVIDKLGARIGQRNLPTTNTGYTDLEHWASSLGEIEAFGIEGTGSYGAGLARFLTGQGYSVFEVNRPDRSTRRRLGRSDPTDAEMAARAVLAGVARDQPKSGVDKVEMIRMLKSTKDSATKARTQAINQMKALIVTAPMELRALLSGLTTGQLVARCKGWSNCQSETPITAAKHSLRSLALRYSQLTEEIEGLSRELERLTKAFAPMLMESLGVGPDTAAALLVTAGSNPERLKSEAAFAALCGVSPIPASSGKTNRHRLNRGGNRQANAALYRIVVVRLRYDIRTRTYFQRRTEEGKTKTEVIRCLKRYVAREVFGILHDIGMRHSVQNA